MWKLLSLAHSALQRLPRVAAFLPAILWVGLIYWFSSQSTLPGPQVDWMDFVFKKAAHVFVYAVLFTLILLGHRRTWPSKNTNKAVLFAIIIAILYAFFDEYHQSLVPNRTASVRDVGYDALGVGLVCLRIYRYI